MPQFEMTFEIPAVPEAVEDAVADAMDAVIATHSGVTLLTVEIGADGCVEAARSAIAELRSLGAPPVRLVDDLVTRSQIADRTGVTRQAVNLWVNGQRQAGTVFPAPFVLAGGGLWLWGEVVEALRARGTEIDDGVAFPTRRDSQIIGGMLATSHGSETWVTFDTGFTFGVTSGDEPTRVPLPAPRSLLSTDFTFAA
ncbi:helix-turn-helix transcriptional regulator [Sanguibacter suaedae]|uniref:Helix-turn-helix domain-containing protein n=1 Tax=Sanguibacter suaedae TaxID=2795737 RepID=A0A934MC80_9MICO|nr:helix-turn-helix domain-containing protein [Sanguibacter suaedae]MBI9113624.1 helix-turn-helix domain-containing protein [Sanguibacter suaedae]